MSQAVESSVVVSLDEIMRAEQDRLRAEATAKDAERAAERAARENRERERRETETQRLEHERDRRWRQECREREERARLEAIRLAELDRAHREADRIAQEETARQAKTAKESTVIPRLHRQLLIAWISVAAVIAISTLVNAVAVADANRRADARLADLSARHAAAEDEWTRERARLALQVDKADQRAIAAFARATKAERELDALKSQKGQPPAGRSSWGPTPLRDPESNNCQPVCPRGDPLCVECRR
jgi:hypothetical protein